jgi:hypothetical protein
MKFSIDAIDYARRALSGESPPLPPESASRPWESWEIERIRCDFESYAARGEIGALARMLGRPKAEVRRKGLDLRYERLADERWGQVSLQ